MIALQEAEVFFKQDKEKLQELAFDTRIKNLGNKILFYKRPFDPVSITKTRCELSCKHCNTHYLEHMHQVDSPESLEKLALELLRSKVKGLVVSGGSRRDGSVPTYEFKDSLKKIRRETGLKINAHTGILNKKHAHEVSGFIDAALTDVIGDKKTIKEILGLDYGPEEYQKTLHYLRDFGVENISPHIIVGLYNGKIRGELKALELLREIDPDNIVIVVFIPTEGTEMENVDPPSIEDVSKIISIARLMYPEKNISLSCVRPGGRYRLELDREAVKSGVNKIAVPSKSAYEAAEELCLEIEEIDESRCCSW
ncbi:MAG: radical SAM protein [Candidatus Altiarchaeota archaeon]|nr:radical SAM protein [Candidatus Altiarchaeota archaeon]